jgi:hypothetical protein
MDQVRLNFRNTGFTLWCAEDTGQDVKDALDKLVAAYDEAPEKEARIAVLMQEVDRLRDGIKAMKRGGAPVRFIGDDAPSVADTHTSPIPAKGDAMPSTLERIQRKHDDAIADLTDFVDSLAHDEDRKPMLEAIGEVQAAFDLLHGHHETLRSSIEELLEDDQ